METELFDIVIPVGPNDTTVWIFRRSPYVQNCTAFGSCSTGLKIDGNLHNGGNKSMVANDFTHIISDGVGVWCTGPGSLTELVSIFSYFGYSGYLAENGGRIRATNGNSSYGSYGVIAEGFDPKMGARPLQRKIDEMLRVPLSKKILFDRIKNAIINARIENDEIVFDVQQKLTASVGPDGIITVQAE